MQSSLNRRQQCCWRNRSSRIIRTISRWNPSSITCNLFTSAVCVCLLYPTLPQDWHDAQSTAGRPTAKESRLSSPRFISVRFFTEFKLCVEFYRFIKKIEHVDALKNTTACEKCLFQMSTCLHSRQTCHNVIKKQGPSNNVADFKW